MKNISIASWLIILFPFYILIPIIFFGSIAVPSSPLTWIGLILAVLGWIFLVRAKWPNLKNFEFMSFGSKGLPPKELRLYKAAYALIIYGAILILLSRILLF